MNCSQVLYRNEPPFEFTALPKNVNFDQCLKVSLEFSDLVPQLTYRTIVKVTRICRFNKFE